MRFFPAWEAETEVSNFQTLLDRFYDGQITLFTLVHRSPMGPGSSGDSRRLSECRPLLIKASKGWESPARNAIHAWPSRQDAEKALLKTKLSPPEWDVLEFDHAQFEALHRIQARAGFELLIAVHSEGAMLDDS